MEPLRLSAHAQWKGQPTREQQQLHYQWFADLGSTEAKRALGQMLTQGAQRDPAAALRYFRSAPVFHACIALMLCCMSACIEA